ncbi:MAG: GNAT family N-acetyltransferase [Bacteroidota bacterium]
MKGTLVFLRALEPEDIDTLYNWENDTSLWPVSNTLSPFSRFTLEQYVMNAGQDIFATKQLRLMIVEQHSGETVGTVDLFDFEPSHHRAGIGIMIKSDNRRQGLAGDALKLMLDYSFNTLDLHQLYCNISPNNEASLQLFKKQGFEIVGLKKQWLKRPSGWEDEYLLQKIHK